MVFLGQCHPNPLRVQQVHYSLSVGEVGAGTIAKRVAGTGIVQVEEPAGVMSITIAHVCAVGEPQLGADAGMPLFGQGFRELHPNAVHFEIVPVVIHGE